MTQLPLGVNIVAVERDLIEEVKNDAFWRDPTEDKLRAVVQRLGPLMSKRDERSPDPMKLDLADVVALKEGIEFGPSNERMSRSAYRAKVETYVKTLVAENPVLQAIQRGEAVSDADVEALADLLARHDLSVTAERLRIIYDNKRAVFIQFIRHILGLEQLENWTVEVTKKFDQFIAGHSDYSSLQIRFLQTLRTFVLEARAVERQHLIDPPFTNLHPKGIRGVFSQGEIDEILAFAAKLVA